MRTVHLLTVTFPALAVLALAPHVPLLSPALCLVAVLITGELWVRALIREPLAAGARVGLAVAAGLISLPLIALALHLLGVRIEGRWLAAGLALLAGGLGSYAWRRESAGNETHPVHGVGAVEQPGVTVSPRSSTGKADDVTHPVHGVGRVEQPGTTGSSLQSTTRRLSPTVLAVGVPALLAIVIGGAATVVYQRLPHPAEPGYTSLALAGWAAAIARPVAFPATGLVVPLEVSSAGEEPSVVNLLVHVGGRLAGPGLPVTIGGGTQTVRVHVPSPANGCLHVIRISLGPASTIFYGRGPGPARMLAPAPTQPPAKQPAKIRWIAC